MKALILLGFRHKKSTQNECLVPRTGIEPAHPCEYQILSLARLPIPPSGLFYWAANVSILSLIRNKYFFLK